MKKLALVVLMTGLMTASYGWDWNTTVKNGKMVPAGRHLVETGITGDLFFMDVPLNYYYGLLDNLTLGLGTVINLSGNYDGQDVFFPVSFTPGITFRILEFQGFGIVAGAEVAVSYYRYRQVFYNMDSVVNSFDEVKSEGFYCFPEAGLYLEFWPAVYSGLSAGCEAGYEFLMNSSSRGLLISGVAAYHHIFFDHLTLDVGVKVGFSGSYMIISTGGDMLQSGRYFNIDTRLGWIF